MLKTTNANTKKAKKIWTARQTTSVVERRAVAKVPVLPKLALWGNARPSKPQLDSADGQADPEHGQRGGDDKQHLAFIPVPSTELPRPSEFPE